MANIYETVNDIGLKACINKVRELGNMLSQCNRLADVAGEGLGNLLESPLGTVEAAKLQLDYQYKVAIMIKDALRKHDEVYADMQLNILKAYKEWQKQHDLQEKERAKLSDLRPHD